MTDDNSLPLAPLDAWAQVVPIDDLDRSAAGRTSNALEVLRLAIVALDAQREVLLAAGDYETLAHGGADVEALIRDLGTLLNQVRRDVATLLDALPRKNRRAKPRVEVPGLGVVEVMGGNDWKRWDSERLLRHLIYATLVSEDGEVVSASPTEVADRIANMLVEVLPITESLGWRRGTKQPDGTWSGLRGWGIDLEDWAERVGKPRLATIPKRP